jgi:hypothetical protein
VVVSPVGRLPTRAALYRFIEGENVNDFIRQKNTSRNICRDSFDILALRPFGCPFGSEDAIASCPRFSEREEHLRFQMRGLPRE